MKMTILIRASLRAIRKHAVRSFLTVLGIMIGIIAIIITFSVGAGAEIKIREQILAMGEGAIYIIPGNIIERGQVRSNLGKPTKIQEKDLDAIIKQVSTVKYASRGHEHLPLMEHGLNAIQERLVGADPTFVNITNYTMKKGQFFNDFHLQNRLNVVVIGNELAKKLFKTEDPIDGTIMIDNIPFTVIGVLDKINFFWGTNDPNVRAYIPFSVADKYFRKPELKTGDLGFIALEIEPEKIPGTTLRKVKRVLRFMHDIDPGASDDFTIFDQETIAESAQRASKIIKLFGLIAAMISLLVGGIGIMNIMLVSVQERTKEIGIRLALGATQKMVQTQFLIEAGIISLLGGLIGVVVGSIAQYILSRITNLPGYIAPTPLLFALLSTIAIGVFFGFYPARKASMLNPVDALMEK